MKWLFFGELLGDPHDLPYKLYPAMLGGSDPFGTHRIAEILEKETPDMVIAVNDIWIINQLWEKAKPVKKRLTSSGMDTFRLTVMDSLLTCLLP